MTTTQERKIYKLNDGFIYQLAKLLQLSLLTGTNMADHMRLMRLEQSPTDQDSVSLTPEYTEYFDETVLKLVSDVETLSKEEDTPASNVQILTAKQIIH